MTVTAVIVTSCTQRKSARPRIDAADLPRPQDVNQLAVAWRLLVAQAVPDGTVQSLYQGRSISEVSAAAAHLGSPWWVVSAGLGLVRSNELVPPYECTVTAGSELAKRLKLTRATDADWWNALTAPQPHPLSRLISKFPTLLALPSSYLRMVHDDLARVPPAKAEQLRIFTSTAGARYVPEHLACCVLPYDDRLESVSKYGGTQSDFAQRALRHFVQELEATSRPLLRSRGMVAAALVHQPRRQRSTGTRMPDEDIRRVLTEQWARHKGSSTRLLRYLRDDASISCEQKRFSRLWQALAVELREGGSTCP